MISLSHRLSKPSLTASFQLGYPYSAWLSLGLQAELLTSLIGGESVSCPIFVISEFCQYNIFKTHIRVFYKITLFFVSCRGKSVTTHQTQVGLRIFPAQFWSYKKILNTLSSYHWIGCFYERNKKIDFVWRTRKVCTKVVVCKWFAPYL